MSGVAVGAFNPRRDIRGHNPYGYQLPHVNYLYSAIEVSQELRNAVGVNKNAYRFAVLKYYCDLKLARGKSKAELREKIMILENELRGRYQLARTFDEIREYYRLGPCQVTYHHYSSEQLSNTAALNRAHTVSTPVRTQPLSSPIARTSTRTSTRPATQRAADEPGDEPPPPPYAADDPEPEATALLRAVQEAEGTVTSPTLANPPASSPASSTHRRSQSDAAAVRRISAASGNSVPGGYPGAAAMASSIGSAASISSPIGDAPRPNHVPASPAARAGNQSLAVASSPPHRPSTPVSAAEQRIREESELEEAMRASRAAEKERLEYQRAIQESLAQYEEDTVLRSYDGEAAAGPSSRPETSASSVANSSRGESSHAPSLPMPAFVGSSASASAPAPSSAIPEDLMDALASLDFGGTAPLTPTAAPARNSLPAQSSPSAHATATLKSKNPFLSQAERNEWSDSDSSDDEPLSAVRDRERDLPPLPAEGIQYAAPNGPPPNWRGPPPPSIDTAAPSVPPRQSSPYSPYGPPPPRQIPAIVTTQATGSSNNVLSPGFYTPAETSPAVPHNASPAPVLIGGENALEMLREYDTVFLIDDSTSMKGERWETAKVAIMGVVQQAISYDEDGIDVYFLNSKRVGKGLRTTDDVEELFAGLEPRGATPTGLRMEAILREYMSKLERSTEAGETVRSMNLIVVTDGAFSVPFLRRIRSISPDERAASLAAAPTDDPESVLITIAKRLDRGDYPLSQVGVQLLQIGDDSEAREALQELDEGLSAAHNVRDMVDTVPYHGEAMTANLIVKVLLGGINRRIDRRF